MARAVDVYRMFLIVLVYKISGVVIPCFFFADNRACLLFYSSVLYLGYEGMNIRGTRV